MRICIYASAVVSMMLTAAFGGNFSTTFNQWETTPVVIGDKLFTYIAGGSNFNDPGLVFSDTTYPGQEVYAFNINFNPGITNTTVDLDYSITALNPALQITGLGIDTIIGSLGTNFNLTKTYYSSPGHVDQVAQLVSVNGSNASVTGEFGSLLYVHLVSVIPAGNSLDSIRDGYTQSTVPEPSSLALLFVGGGVLFGGAYRRRCSATVASQN